MAEGLIIPKIGFNLSEDEVFIPREQLPPRTGKKKFESIAEGLGFQLGEWKVMPKKWKHGGQTFHGFMLTRKL